MPFIDVSEILSDPDIAGETFTVERVVRTMSSHGRVVDTPQQFSTFGNIQPAESGQLMQLPEDERLIASISVTTPFELRPLTNDHGPDVVLWNNQRWRVVKIDPFRNYGTGFTTAICQLTAMTYAEISQLRFDQ